MRRRSPYFRLVLCLLVVGCDPITRGYCSRCALACEERKTKRTPLRHRHLGPCTIEVLDPVPPLTYGLLFEVIEGGDINTGLVAIYDWDPGSRLLTRSGCTPDGGTGPRWPLEVNLVEFPRP